MYSLTVDICKSDLTGDQLAWIIPTAFHRRWFDKCLLRACCRNFNATL